MRKISRFFCAILSIVIVLTMGMNSNAVLRVQAASSVTGNNTKTTAYNCGSWNSMNSLPTAILHADQQQSWFKFTVAAKEKIYVRVSTETDWEGTSIYVQDTSGKTLHRSNNPENIIFSSRVTPARV